MIEVSEPAKKRDTKWIATEEVSEMSGLSKQAIYDRVRSRQIPHHRYGTTIKFLKEDIQAWINEHKVSPVI